MGQLTAQQVAEVKAKGFVRNRKTDDFSGRIPAPGTVFSAETLAAVAEIARRFGNGKAIPTSRLSIEVPGIPYEKIPDVMAFAEENGLRFGGTGAKVRPVTACKGTTCVYGNFDTQALAKKIFDTFYTGWREVSLPHKFKIGVGGCPNSCMKPSLNDFGVEGRKAPVYDPAGCRGCTACQVEKACPSKAAKVEGGKLAIHKDACLSCGVCTGKCPFDAVKNHDDVGYQIYVGGMWGKKTRIGTPLSGLVHEEDIFPILEKVLLWYRENAYQKERLGAAVDRLGLDRLAEALQSPGLLLRKEEILAAPIKQ